MAGGKGGQCPLPLRLHRTVSFLSLGTSLHLYPLLWPEQQMHEFFLKQTFGPKKNEAVSEKAWWTHRTKPRAAHLLLAFLQLVASLSLTHEADRAHHSLP